MSNTFYSRLFLLAAIFNCAAGVTGMLFYQFQFSLFFGELAVMQNFHMALLFRLFMLAVILFGLGYYLVSRDLGQNRGLVWLGALGKIGVFIAFGYAFTYDLLTPAGMTIASMDLIWAMLFFYFLSESGNGKQTKRETE